MDYHRAEDVVEVRQVRLGVKKGALAVLTLGSVGLMGFLGGQHYAPKQPNDRVVGKVFPNSTEFAVVPYTPECYGFTGGTCATSDCNPSRNAVCDVAKCVCQNGCTTIEGTCGSGKNKKIASHFTLSNEYWPNFEMYVPRLDMTTPISVSNWPTSTFHNAQYFNLFELNGDVNGKKKYFLASDNWPTWVAAIGHSSTSIYGAYAYNLDHTIAPWDPEGVVVDVCDMSGKGHPGSLMIGDGSHWFYVSHTSWKVSATAISSDPGVTGYWKPDPAIEGLQACD